MFIFPDGWATEPICRMPGVYESANYRQNKLQKTREMRFYQTRGKLMNKNTQSHILKLNLNFQ